MRQDLINLELYSLSITEYKQRIISLASFVANLHMLDSMLENISEVYLSLSNKDIV